MPEVKPDLSEFAEIANQQPETCVIARSAARLEPQARVNFNAGLAEKDPYGNYVWGHNTLATFLSRRGLGGRDEAVRKHRNGECCCEG